MARTGEKPIKLEDRALVELALQRDQGAFALLLEVLNGKMTKNEALGYYGSMDIFCLGPVI